MNELEYEEYTTFESTKQEPTEMSYFVKNCNHNSSKISHKQNKPGVQSSLKDLSYDINPNSQKQISNIRHKLSKNTFSVEDNNWNKKSHITSEKQYKIFFEDKERRDNETAIFLHENEKLENEKYKHEKSEFIKKQRKDQKDL